MSHATHMKGLDDDDDNGIDITALVKLAVKTISDLLSKRGTAHVNGRKIKYRIRPKTSKLQLKYYCKVKDVASGIKGRADNKKGQKGALEHALVDLYGKLESMGELA